MPRKFERKKGGKYQSNYSKDDVKMALLAVKNGTMSIRRAAKSYNVPRSTLYDRVSEKYDIDARPGRKPALPGEVEKKIVETLKEASRQGIGISRRQLLSRTGQICKNLRVTPFKNATPSKDWWMGLKKRHPELSIRRPEKLGTSRASMTNPVVIDNYFKDLGKLINDLGLKDKPKFIWNCDETGRSFEHNPVKVIAEKSARNVVGKTSNNRTNVTIMACVNAVGRWMPPMFVAKGKTSASLHGFNSAAAPEGTKWSFQENGCMNDEIGEKWFRCVFLEECGPERPQLLILDGHSSHESLAILELASQNRIHILSLPPHTTHLLQPLDRAVFGPFSNAFNIECSNYINENILHSVNKWSFPGLVKNAWDQSFTPENIRSGFRACGIYPFNRNAIPSSAFEPSNQLIKFNLQPQKTKLRDKTVQLRCKV